jgi:two-component sensor histidine kinase/PAS domain-containing protein
MDSIYDICHGKSALSDVQIRILNNSRDLLQFASDISQREVAVYVPGKQAGTLVLAGRRTPLFQQLSKRSDNQVGTVMDDYDEPVVLQVLKAGKAIRGAKETEYGKMEPLMAYPFVDNAGDTIAAITFVGPAGDNRDFLTETAFMALQVPIEDTARKLYAALSVQDGIILISGDGKIIYANEMADSIMHLRGRDPNLVGTNIYNSKVNLAGAKRALASHEGFVEDIVHGKIIFTQRVIPILRSGKVFRVVIIITERTELHRKEEELMVKTSVIKEIHHRVKNNLQTIASLLRMQMRRVDSQEARDALGESLHRILSISLVHEILSHHDEETIDISDVAQKLLALLMHSMVSNESHITSSFDGDELPLPSAEATSLALVINELITNALAHGFEGLQDGNLSVCIHNQGKLGELVIADTGRGFDINKIDKTKKHLGLQIVSTLVEKDLHGTLEYDSIEPSGTKVLIRFPLESKGE